MTKITITLEEDDYKSDEDSLRQYFIDLLSNEISLADDCSKMHPEGSHYNVWWASWRDKCSKKRHDVINGGNPEW